MGVSRDFSIVYGSLTIGGASTTIQLHADPPWQVEHEYDRTRVRFRVRVRGATESAFAAAQQAFESGMRAINQTTTLTMGGSEIISASHSDNTGFLSRASASKPGLPGDMRLSCTYDGEITFLRPADASGKGGLQSAKILPAQAFADGRYSLTISGVYTATNGSPNKSAVENYDDNVEALATTWKDIFASGASWVLDDHDSEPEEENKTLRFRRVYIEVTPTGRIDANEDVAEGPNEQRIVTLSGRYADMGSGALAAYDADADTYAGDALTALTGIAQAQWDELEHKRTPEDQDARMSFVRRFKEVMAAQPGATSGLNNAKVVDPFLQVFRTRLGSENDMADAERPLEMGAVFGCWVTKAVTNLDEFYKSTIRPHIIQEIRNKAETSLIALKRETPRLREFSRRIDVEMEFIAVSGSRILAHTTETIDIRRKGIDLLPVWVEGKPYARALFDDVPAVHLKVITDSRLVVGTARGLQGGASGGGGGVGVGVGAGGTAGTISTISRADAESGAGQPVGTGGDLTNCGLRPPGANWHEREDLRSFRNFRLGTTEYGFGLAFIECEHTFEYGEVVAVGAAGSGPAQAPNTQSRADQAAGGG